MLVFTYYFSVNPNKINYVELVINDVYLKIFFDQNHKYYTDRVLNCARIYKNASKPVSFKVKDEENCIIVGDMGITLIIYNNNMYTALVKVTELRMDRNVRKMIPVSYFEEDNNSISCQFVLATRVLEDSDNEHIWRWYGSTGNIKITTDYKNMLFPIFSHDENDTNCVIYVTLDELQNSTSIILARQKDINSVTFKRVSRMTFDEGSLPYCKELQYALDAANSVSKSSAKNAKVTEKRNDKENEVKISDVMMCFNCVDNNEFGMGVIVFHQMKHKLDGEMRQNRGPKQILDLLPCHFCG
eukprot:37110_1